MSDPVHDVLVDKVAEASIAYEKAHQALELATANMREADMAKTEAWGNLRAHQDQLVRERLQCLVK